MRKWITLTLITTIFLLLDFYLFELIRTLVHHPEDLWWAQWVYWAFNGTALFAFLTYQLAPLARLRPVLRSTWMSSLLITYFAKFFVVLFVLADDLRRLLFWSSDSLMAWMQSNTQAEVEATPRSALWMQAGAIAVAVPVGVLTYGVAIGAHDYKLVRKKIRIPHLPPDLEGLTIGQISDIHAGSLYSRKGVRKGVKKLMAAAPDIICFTGDLVNSRAEEISHTFDIFETIDAPLGVFSILGNHDYGHYAKWPSGQAKEENLQLLKMTHEWLGWDLLLDEHRKLSIGGATLALAGVENWGASDRMPKYGRIEKALAGTEEANIRVLLSHDPSHWSAQVLPFHQHVELTLSGHTHGMQFGLHTKKIKWSPVQYHTRHWSGLYHQDAQYLYVNRGFGFHGFPGRIGMPPEITLLTLTGKPAHA